MLLLQSWSNVKLRTKGLLIVAVPAAATVLIAGAAWLTGSRADRAEYGVNQAIEARARIEELKAEEVDASASVRGYLLAGDERLDERIGASFAVFEATEGKLAALTAGQHEQQRRLDRIAALERARVETIVAAVARYQSGILSAEDQRNEVLTAGAERSGMETLIEAMLAEEERILSERSAYVRELRFRSSAVIAGCALGGVAAAAIHNETARPASPAQPAQSVLTSASSVRAASKVTKALTLPGQTTEDAAKTPELPKMTRMLSPARDMDYGEADRSVSATSVIVIGRQKSLPMLRDDQAFETWGGEFAGGDSRLKEMIQAGALTSVERGAKVRVLEVRGKLTHIEVNGQGRTGWIRSASLGR